MSNAIMLQNVTPQQLQNLISESTKSALAELSASMQPNEPDEWLTRQETADLLKITLSTIHDWVKRDILKPYKIGNRTYFNRNEITEQMFNSNKQ